MSKNALLLLVCVSCARVAPVPSKEGAAPAAAPSLPQTRTEEVSESLHGVTVTDAFRWLEDEKSTQVQEWMAAQDTYARTQLRSLAARAPLLARYRELYYLDSVSPPVKRGGRYFYLRTHKDREKAILYWRDGEGGKEQVLVDPNAFSQDGTVSLGRFVPSWDGRYVVFQKKPNAADEATLYVVEVDSGKTLDVDVLEGGKYATPQWVPDSSGFYYEFLPTDPSIPVAERPGHTELRFHRLGTPASKDVLVHPSTRDPSTFLNGELSADGKYLFVSIARGWSENDLYVQRVGQKDARFQLLVKGHQSTWQVISHKDTFYLLTDENAPNKKVVKVDARAVGKAPFVTVVPEDKEAALQDMALVGGHLSLLYLRKAASEVRLFSLSGKEQRTLPLPGLGTARNLVGQADDDEAYFAFSSFTLPSEVWKVSVRAARATPWSKVEVPIDTSRYTVEQVFYPSKDGTKVSMFLVHQRGLLRDGSHPVLLFGYGGFDVSLTSQFNAFIYPWLEAGGVYAVPNLRGGGEYGKAWHDAGKGALKQNVFDDFIAAAEFLVAQGYTTPRKLAIRGGSNGGLLVGAAMTQRPDLFRAVICAVPLLDMVRYHLYGSGKTWIPEYGNPEKPEDFRVLHAYSPYHRLKRGGRYPALLMMGADRDDRVDPMHARKFVAALQATGSPGPAWLRIEANAGHGGADQVARTIESSADQLGFLFETLEVKSPAGKPAR